MQELDTVLEKSINPWNKLIDRLIGWYDTAVENLPNIVAALLIFFAFYWLSGLFGRWLQKYLRNFIKTVSVRELVSTSLSIFLLAIGLFLALAVLNLDQFLYSLLAGAGVAGLAVGLALQGPLTNTFSGIFLAVKDIMNVGDWIETNGYMGEVVEINLRNTKLKTPDNNVVVIPNKMVVENPFKNYALTSRIRITLTCGIHYSTDLELAQKVVTKTLEEAYKPLSHEKIEFHYTEFADSSINFQVRFWTNAKDILAVYEAKSHAIVLIKQAFDQHGITIPFPIRTIVHENLPSN